MAEEFQSVTYEKGDSRGMRSLSVLLGRIGIVDKKSFMGRFAMTIGKTIYVPFRIGEGDPRTLWAQILTCVHEHEHVAQYAEHGWWFMAKYILRSADRVHFEAEAYRTELELTWWRTKQVMTPSIIVNRLKEYGLARPDLLVAEKTLALSIPPIMQGAVFSKAGAIAIDWLDANAQQLREGARA